MRYRMIVHSLGDIVLLLLPAMAVSAVWSLLDGTPDIYSFGWTMLVVLAVGLALRSVKPEGSINRREGFAIVGCGWVLMAALGALPLFLFRAVPSYTDAFFETMSGFTTTGATILGDIQSLPRGLLFWRSMTHWLGGMGIIVLSLAVFSIFHSGSALYQAEVPGHAKEKFLPRLKQAASTLWCIYAGLSLAEMIALMAAGMSPFDSAVHTFGTMATGGFSSRNASIQAFNSPVVESIIIVFMILAGLNFSLYYRVLQKRKLRLLFNVETRTYFAIIGLAFVFVCASLALEKLSLFTAARQAVFQVVSIMTTTGFTSSNYDVWPPLAKGVLFLLMFVGGCTGSTGGSVKVARVVLLAKYAWRQVLRVARPRLVMRTSMDGEALDDSIVHGVMAFFTIYAAIFVFGSVVVMATGQNLLTSFSASAATLGNVGPGLAAIGPTGNYAGFHPAAKWILSLLMLAGRLEIFTVLVMFSPSFWRR